MLNKSTLYNLMTVKQLNKRVDKIKIKLDKAKTFEERLNLLDDLAAITGVLVRRCKQDIAITNYVMDKLNDMASLVK